MFKLYQKPSQWLLITAAVLVTASAFGTNRTFDIKWYDTYLVIFLPHWLLTIASVLLWAWLVNLWTNRFLASATLTRVHVVLMIFASLFLAVVSFYSYSYYSQRSGMWERFDEGGLVTFGDFDTVRESVVLGLFLVIAGLFIYVINLVAGVFKRMKLKF